MGHDFSTFLHTTKDACPDIIRPKTCQNINGSIRKESGKEILFCRKVRKSRHFTQTCNKNSWRYFDMKACTINNKTNTCIQMHRSRDMYLRPYTTVNTTYQFSGKRLQIIYKCNKQRCLNWNLVFLRIISCQLMLWCENYGHMICLRSKHGYYQSRGFLGLMNMKDFLPFSFWFLWKVKDKKLKCMSNCAQFLPQRIKLKAFLKILTRELTFCFCQEQQHWAPVHAIFGVCTNTYVFYQNILEKRPIGQVYRKGHNVTSQT